MKNPNVKSEPSVLSQGYDTLSVSRDMWPRLEQLIQEAESIKIQANKMVDSLLDSTKNGKIAKACYDSLKKSKLYALVCGEARRARGAQNDRTYCKLFWSSFRAALHDQFNRFAVLDDDTREAILEAAVDNKNEPSGFWNAVPDELENKIGRIWFLVAHANVLREIEEHKKLKAVDLKAIFKIGVGDVLSELSPRSRDVPRPKYWHGPYREGRFDHVRRFAAWRLLHRFQGNPSWFREQERWDKFRIPDDDDLVQYLGLMLSRGAESAPAVEISQLLRILVGRYLNKSTAFTEWEHSLREGIRYVLSKQNELDGSWELPKMKGSPSLFLHQFSPLLHILDLDTELLRLEGALLVEACSRALASARRTLAALPRNFDDPKQFDDILTSLASSVAAGLSLSMTVSDRLKDLLSDLILRSRKAEDGDIKLSCKNIPNSLRFRDNIEKGVIEPWLKYDTRRPGAILIYGPPGTGKTTVARIIASELNQQSAGQRVGPVGTDRWRFLPLSPADFAREGADGIVACAERLFGELKRVRRCVVLLDEMEEFLRARGIGSDRDSRLVTTAFLPLLQEAVKSREVILVVATNFVGNIDAAVTRQGRFDMILPLGPPDKDARIEILKKTDYYKKVMVTLPDKPKKKGGLTKRIFEEAVAEYSMGYAMTELESFFLELWGNIKEDIENSRTPKELEDLDTLTIELWRMRAKLVPIALSGRAGSDWRAFEDEVKRYPRYAPNYELKHSIEYWREPDFPRPNGQRIGRVNRTGRARHAG